MLIFVFIRSSRVYSLFKHLGLENWGNLLDISIFVYFLIFIFLSQQHWLCDLAGCLLFVRHHICISLTNKGQSLTQGYKTSGLCHTDSDLPFPTWSNMAKKQYFNIFHTLSVQLSFLFCLKNELASTVFSSLFSCLL